MPTLLSNAQQKALTTLARAKAFLDISGDSKDGLISMLANMATGFIETYTKRRFLRQTYTNEEYDGTGTNVLVLRQFPVVTLSSLQVNTSGDSSASWQSIDTVNYFGYEDGRVALNSPVAGFLDADAGCFIEAPNKYRATYTAGYLIDFDNENDPTRHTLPQEIEYACLKLISSAMNSRKGEGLSSAKVGDLAMTFRKGVIADEEIKEILGKYASATI